MSDVAKPRKKEDLAVKERATTKGPRMYKVLLHNDDFTTMEFVVWILMELFNKSQTEAMQIMLHVHHKGMGVAGVYTYDMAQTKVKKVLEVAREHGHPLKCTAEPEE
ncbi:MAG: ATP-dependent Clp protease adapter ClpS [Pseudomonadota bacterium]